MCHCSTERAQKGLEEEEHLNIPKQFEAAEPEEEAGSLQLALSHSKLDAFTWILAQQGSASRAEKGVAVCRKGPEPVEVPSLHGKILTCERPGVVCFSK